MPMDDEDEIKLEVEQDDEHELLEEQLELLEVDDDEQHELDELRNELLDEDRDELLENVLEIPDCDELDRDDEEKGDDMMDSFAFIENERAASRVRQERSTIPASYN